jgi:hypothetical protein
MLRTLENHKSEFHSCSFRLLPTSATNFSLAFVMHTYLQTEYARHTSCIAFWTSHIPVYFTEQKYRMLFCSSHIHIAKGGTARTLHSCCVVLCIVCFVTFPVLFVCICVLNNYHRMATQLQLNISYHIIFLPHRTSVIQITLSD